MRPDTVSYTHLMVVLVTLGMLQQSVKLSSGGFDPRTPPQD